MGDSYEIEEAISIKEPKLERNQSIAQSVKKLSRASVKKLSDEEKQVLIEMFAGVISNSGDSKRQNERRTGPGELESKNSSRTTRPPVTSKFANQTPCKTPFQAPVSSIRKPCFTFEHLKKYKNIDLLAQCTLNCNDDGSYSTDLCRQHLLTQESRIPTCNGRSGTKRKRSIFRMHSSSSLSSSCQNSESNVQVQERPNLQQTMSRPLDQTYEQQTDFGEIIKSCLKCELDSRLGALSTKAVNITRPAFCVSFPEASENPSNQQNVAYNKGDKRLKFQESPCFPNPTECDAPASIPPPYNAPCLQQNPETVRNYPFISPQRQTRNYPEVCAEQSYQPVVTYPSSSNSEHFRTVSHPCNVCEQFSKSVYPPCKEQYSKVQAYPPCSVEQFSRTTRSALNMESFPKAFCLPCHDQYSKSPVSQDCNSLQYSRNVYPSCLDQRSEAISPPCRMQYPESPHVHPAMDPPFDTGQYALPAPYPSYSSQPFHQSYPSQPFHQSYPSQPFHQSFPSQPFNQSFPSHAFHQSYQSYPFSPHPFHQSYPSHQPPPSYPQPTYPPHPSYPPYPSYNPSDPFLRPVASLQRNQMPQEEMPIAPQASVYNFPPQSRIRKPSLEKVNKSSQTCACIGNEPSKPFVFDPQVKREAQTSKFQEIARDIQALKLSKRDYSPWNLGDDFHRNFRYSTNNLDKSCESKHVFFKAENGYNFNSTSAVPNQVIVPGLSCRSDYSQINQPIPPNTLGCLPNAQKKDEPQDLVLNMNFIPCCGTRTCWPGSNSPRYYSIKIP